LNKKDFDSDKTLNIQREIAAKDNSAVNDISYSKHSLTSSACFGMEKDEAKSTTQIQRKKIECKGASAAVGKIAKVKLKELTADKKPQKVNTYTPKYQSLDIATPSQTYIPSTNDRIQTGIACTKIRAFKEAVELLSSALEESTENGWAWQSTEW